MAESCKLASHGIPCHEACAARGDDQSETASFSADSSGSFCSLASNLSESNDATSSPPGHPSQPSSTSSSTLQLNTEGPLYELSSLLTQLPVRKGLSKYYQGKSQSFTSISDATCVQDLAKKMSHSKRMKTCKSYAAGLDMNRRSNNLTTPCNMMIAKGPSKGSLASAMPRTRNTSLLYSSAKPSAHQSGTPEQEISTNAYWFITKCQPKKKN